MCRCREEGCHCRRHESVECIHPWGYGWTSLLSSGNHLERLWRHSPHSQNECPWWGKSYNWLLGRMENISCVLDLSQLELSGKKSQLEQECGFLSIVERKRWQKPSCYVKCPFMFKTTIVLSKYLFSLFLIIACLYSLLTKWTGMHLEVHQHQWQRILEECGRRVCLLEHTQCNFLQQRLEDYHWHPLG